MNKQVIEAEVVKALEDNNITLLKAFYVKYAYTELSIFAKVKEHLSKH